MSCNQDLITAQKNLIIIILDLLIEFFIIDNNM